MSKGIAPERQKEIRDRAAQKSFVTAVTKLFHRGDKQFPSR